MKHNATVCIDHCTIYCKDKAPLNALFTAACFFSKNNVHYMTRNSYFELYQPGPGESYDFFRSEAGLHSFIFWNDDIDACYGRVTGAGYATAMPVSDFSRPADHGEPRGMASFRGFYMATPLLPIGETAVVQQMSMAYIYPEKPYPHPNGVVGMDKMFLCLENEADRAKAGAELERFCNVLKEGRPERRCITSLEIAGSADFAAEYGVQVDPARSCCTGIRFVAEDLAVVRGILEQSGLTWHETADHLLCVDAGAQANLFLLFRQQ